MHCAQVPIKHAVTSQMGKMYSKTSKQSDTLGTGCLSLAERLFSSWRFCGNFLKMKSWTKILPFMSQPYMHGPLPEATQSTIFYIKFSSPVTGLLSSVEAQISVTCASTSVVFASAGSPIPHSDNSPPLLLHASGWPSWNIWIRSLKFTVSGRSKQANKQA